MKTDTVRLPTVTGVGNVFIAVLSLLFSSSPAVADGGAFDGLHARDLTPLAERDVHGAGKGQT